MFLFHNHLSYSATLAKKQNNGTAVSANKGDLARPSSFSKNHVSKFASANNATAPTNTILPSGARFEFENIAINNIQAKLKVSQPADPAELEADRIADTVMRTTGTHQLLHTTNSEQGKNSKDADAREVDSAIAAAGTTLDPATRQFMEPRFGHDFSNVRIHAGSSAASSAESVKAHAFTIGNDVVFGKGQYRPESFEGRRLIAHELAHVVQQERASATTTVQRQEKQGDDDDADDKKKKGDAGEVVAEGLKVVAKQAVDNNPKVKKEIIEPLKKAVKDKVDSLSTGEKAIGISFGAATLGLTGGVLLSDPEGRKLLEGVNLAAPLTLIPYVPLTGFSYTLPSGEEGEKSLFKFETAFSGNDYLKFLTGWNRLPKMSLGVKMQWGYDPSAGQLKVLGAQAQLGIMPGVSLSAGTYPDILAMPETFITPEGSLVTIKKRIPDVGGSSSPSIPDTRIMLTIDLLKLDKRVIGSKLHNILSAFR